jgi:hypothetical protein
MLKSKGETCMVEELSHVNQLSPNNLCKIGLRLDTFDCIELMCDLPSELTEGFHEGDRKPPRRYQTCKTLFKNVQMKQIQQTIITEYPLEKLLFPIYTVTRATQNEALLWKITVLGMTKPPVGAGTFCPLSILVFYSLIIHALFYNYTVLNLCLLYFYLEKIFCLCRLHSRKSSRPCWPAFASSPQASGPCLHP